MSLVPVFRSVAQSMDAFLRAEDAYFPAFLRAELTDRTPSALTAQLSWGEVRVLGALIVVQTLVWFGARAVLPHCGLQPKVPLRLIAWWPAASTALVATVSGLPLFVGLASAALAGEPEGWIDSERENLMDRLNILYFLAHFVVDLVLGLIFYPSETDPLSGVFHHVVYFFAGVYALHSHRGRIWRCGNPMEIPTLLLAVSHMHYPARDYLELLFGLSFFLTRDAWLVYIMWTFWPTLPDADRIVCCIALGLHVYWSLLIVKNLIYAAERVKAEKDKGKQE